MLLAGPELKESRQYLPASVFYTDKLAYWGLPTYGMRIRFPNSVRNKVITITLNSKSVKPVKITTLVVQRIQPAACSIHTLVQELMFFNLSITSTLYSRRQIILAVRRY